MSDQQIIQEILKKIDTLFSKINETNRIILNFQLQQGLFEGRLVSEQGRVKRTEDDLNIKIENLFKLYHELHKLLFDREDGIAFILDRIEQREKKREDHKKQLIGLWIAVGLIVVKEILSLIIKLTT